MGNSIGTLGDAGLLLALIACGFAVGPCVPGAPPATKPLVIGLCPVAIIFQERPFGVFLTAAPASGKGMNPLLQNPYLATHPPSLYLGFVSATVPFAFALAALITGNLDDSWLASTRRWMM